MPNLILSVALALPTAAFALWSGMAVAQVAGLYVSTGVAVMLVSAIFRVIGDGDRPQRRSA